jgi:purine nucleosidase
LKYGTDGGPLHDPCVIAWMLQPELFTSRFVNVVIETESNLTMGMTVIDWWRVTERTPNTTVCGGIDADKFFDLLTERVAKLV